MTGIQHEVMPQYDEIWIICRCGQKIGGTILRGERFEFHCVNCYRMWTGEITGWWKDYTTNEKARRPGKS